MISKKLLLIVVVLCIALISTITVAQQMTPTKYKLTFKNGSNQPITYYLYQIDHGLKSYPKPIAFVIGTLDPGKTWVVNRNSSYCYLEWKHKGKLILKIDPFYIDKDMTFVYGGSQSV